MKHHILSIGITKYQLPEANNLNYAHKDAEDIYSLFTKNIASLGYQKLLKDSEATLAQIRSSLGRELQSEVAKDDVLVIYFSGHGTTDKNPNDKDAIHYLVPYDATRDIPSTALPVSYLREALDDIDCRAKIIFIDSCFSGSANNSKHFPNATQKAIPKIVKTLIDVVSGNGEMVFTASKANEESLEDPDNKNGLFTHFLLEELQKDRKSDSIPIEQIFDPLSKGVTERAKNVYGFVQTPTMGGRIEGGLHLPSFKQKILYYPNFIAPQKITTYNPNNIFVPQIEMSDKDTSKQLNSLITFVSQTKNDEDKVSQIEFEKLCIKLFQSLKNIWEKTFSEVGSAANKIPEAVSTLEAQSTQMVMLGNVVASYGSKTQMKVFSKYVGEILKLTEGKAGLVALTTIPEAVVAILVISIGMNCLAREDFEALSIFLKSVVIFDNQGPATLLKQNDIFYCDALGRNSMTVHDHVREIISGYTWISELSPQLRDEEILNYSLQMNLLLVLNSIKDQYPLWADFGRFEGKRVLPFLYKIKLDPIFRKKIADFLEVKESGLVQYVYDSFQKMRSDWSGRGGMFWTSVRNIGEILEIATNS